MIGGNSKRQSQSTGDCSLAVQVAGNFNNGLSYSDVRQVAVDVMKANFLELQGNAKKIIDERFEEFADEFIKRLAEKEDIFSSVQDPDIQYDLVVAGREYARTGDKSLQQILVDLLVERCSTTGRTLRSIVLNEAISTVGKLTQSHISTLTALWAVERTSLAGEVSLDAVWTHMQHNVLPFSRELAAGQADYEYLVYAGCGSINSLSRKAIGRILIANYPGLFQRGWKPEDLPDEWSNYIGSLLIPAEHDQTLLRINTSREEGVEELALSIGHPEWSDKISEYLKKSPFPEDDVEKMLIDAIPELAETVDAWKNGIISSFEPTTVGVAIAHSNWTAKCDGSAPLSIWIP